MLGVAPTASSDEIKKAFRREIAKYHPDKVQHLGQEFEVIAVDKTAELMLAYRTLNDGSLRVDYDAQLTAGLATPSERARPTPSAHNEDAPTGPGTPGRTTGEGASSSESTPSPGRPRVSSPDRAVAGDLVRKAAVLRFREAVKQEFGQCEEAPVQGFDVDCLPPKGSFFSRTVPPRILGRFVPEVDAAAVRESWAIAVRAKKDDQRDLCVFVMGPAVAPVGELGRAITEQRRRPMPAGTLVIVPVNTRTWSAHIPNDAPPAAKALLSRLRSS
jgi:hypothetical protein